MPRPIVPGPVICANAAPAKIDTAATTRRPTAFFIVAHLPSAGPSSTSWHPRAWAEPVRRPESFHTFAPSQNPRVPFRPPPEVRADVRPEIQAPRGAGYESVP